MLHISSVCNTIFESCKSHFRSYICAKTLRRPREGIYLFQSWHSRRILLQSPVHMLWSQTKFERRPNPNSPRCWCWATRCLLGIRISLKPRNTAGAACASPTLLLLRDSNTWGALVWYVTLITLPERNLSNVKSVQQWPQNTLFWLFLAHAKRDL